MKFSTLTEAVGDWLTIAPEFRSEEELSKRLRAVDGAMGAVMFKVSDLREMPSSLNDACRSLEAAADRIDALKSALMVARDAIGSVPRETFGYTNDPTNASIGWPIRAELIWRISVVLEGEEAADVVASEAPTLCGQITAIYRDIDAEDCKLVDHEWARMRGYILPTDGTSKLIAAEPAIEARITQLTDALKSISANTCCDNCREAALVARSALASYVGLARTPPLILAAGCCSATSPCSHQKASPETICETCRQATP